MKVDNDNDNVVFMKHLNDFYKQRLLVALDLTIRDKEFLEAFELASIIIGEFKLLEYKYDFETIKEFAILACIEKYILKNSLPVLIIIIDEQESAKISFIKKFFNDSLRFYLMKPIKLKKILRFTFWIKIDVLICTNCGRIKYFMRKFLQENFHRSISS